MTNDLKFSKEARELMARGIHKLYDAIRVTLGPKGRNVIIEQRYGGPIIVNDGETIARSVNLKNKYENLGSSLVIEAATKTNDVVGDGTTTATILASVMIFEGLNKLDEGVNPALLKRGFDYLAPLVLKMIDEKSIAINDNEDLKKTAINSSNSEEIGETVYQAFMEVGRDGIITIQESKDIKTHLDITKGYGVERGYVSSYMVNNTDKMISDLDDPLILITDKKIIAMQEIIWALEHSIKSGRALVIICDDIEQDVLGTIIVNKLRGVFNAVVVRAPGYGDQKPRILEDLSIITKATFIDSTIGMDLSQASADDLGGASKVIISKDQTTIIDGYGGEETVASRIRLLKHAIDVSQVSYEKEKMAERLAKLTGGVAVIKVGAPTETELKEKKLRFDDALNATKSALKEGIIEGGGKVIYQISTFLEQMDIRKEYAEAKEILIRALKAPFIQILENAGYEYQEIIKGIRDDLWFDAMAGEYGLMIEKGIIDPTSVAKTSLMNAISIASMFLTTECAIIIDEITDKPVNEENLIE